jgi:flagellar FliL protein
MSFSYIIEKELEAVMSDDDDILDGASTIDSGKKKSSLLGGLIPKLLKFIAIGLGALIFIVTVAVITFNFLNQGGRTQTMVSETDPYVGRRPEYTYYSNIDLIRTFTNDASPASVVVKVVLGYDMDDQRAPTELTNRMYEITAYIRQFFALKTADELQPEDEAQLQQEIREALNTRILQTTKIRTVLFQQFDVIRM